jgi:hypothetical protein
MAVRQRSVVSSTCKRCLVLAMLFERYVTGVMACCAPLGRSRFETLMVRPLPACFVTFAYCSVSIAPLSLTWRPTAFALGDEVLVPAAFYLCLCR